MPFNRILLVSENPRLMRINDVNTPSLVGLKATGKLIKDSALISSVLVGTANGGDTITSTEMGCFLGLLTRNSNVCVRPSATSSNTSMLAELGSLPVGAIRFCIVSCLIGMLWFFCPAVCGLETAGLLCVCIGALWECIPFAVPGRDIMVLLESVGADLLIVLVVVDLAAGCMA